jgi:hypothetical protein
MGRADRTTARAAADVLAPAQPGVPLPLGREIDPPRRLAMQRGPDAVVKAMAGRSGAEVAQRGSDKHLHDSRA